MISFPPENTGSRKNWIAVFVILMNMESVPFFFSFQKLVLLLLFCCDHFIRLEGGPVCALLQVCSLLFLALFHQ
jgi:hypothetical protein